MGRLNFPGHSLTLIIKGTFDLKPGKKIEPSEEQLYPTGDEFYPDDEEMEGSPRYEMDFACFKPQADLLLVGKCHAPGKSPVKACRVTFRVGSKSRSLGIFGKRSWKHDVIGLGVISEPRPFRTMELRYEKSYGGAEYKKNPVGKGYSRSLDTVGIKGRYLPNIEDPDNLIETSGSHPQPAGFGPLNRMWDLRHSRMGTYKGKYQKERWPWFPEDFDWSHYNTAPPEMQMDGYLRGDEELLFENLHKKHPEYTSHLPGLRVRSFVNKMIDPNSDKTNFMEVPLNLDTLWVDMESEKLVLVWRGWTEILSEDYDEIQHIFLMSEALEEKPQTVVQCNKLFQIALVEQQEELELIPEEPDVTRLPGEIPSIEGDDETKLAIPILPDDDETQLDIPRLDSESGTKADMVIPGEIKEEKYALIKRIEAQVAAMLSQFGLSLDSLPADAQQVAKEHQERIIKKMTEPDSEQAHELRQQVQDEQLKESLAKLGIDSDNIPPLSDKAKEEQKNFIKEMGLNESELSESKEFDKFWQMMAAIIPQLGFDPENLNPFMEAAKPQMDQIKKQLGFRSEEEVSVSDEGEERIGEEKIDEIDQKSGEDKDESETDSESKKEDRELNEQDETAKSDERKKSEISRENLQKSIADGESLAGMDLSGWDLSGMEMKGADFAGAIMMGAALKGSNLTNANLAGANLVGADLSNANLEKADLQEADVSEGILSGANLSGANLNDTVFEKAKMDCAILDEVEAKDTIFIEVDLSKASLKNSVLSGSDFSNCLLHGADFQGANLSEASVEGAKGQKVNFHEADLTKLRASEKCDFSGGIFTKVNGLESIWQQANLSGADFSFSHMEGADFSKALLERANLSAANMKFSRFSKANLKEAKMILLNLFEGNLEKADLTGADLSGANLYAVEFLETVLDNTILNRANLKMTKLENK
ncbi:MAG: DUF2169 domain-containing protein [Calditrichia bacterium]|nr:DUF2169 domain-containing protein [Calditrichia bacterium]